MKSDGDKLYIKIVEFNKIYIKRLISFFFLKLFKVSQFNIKFLFLKNSEFRIFERPRMCTWSKPKL
jgi:hypothetical protein